MRKVIPLSGRGVLWLRSLAALVVAVWLVGAGVASGQLSGTNFTSYGHRVGGGANTPAAGTILSSASFRTWGSVGQSTGTPYDRVVASTIVPRAAHFRTDVGPVPESLRTLVIAPQSVGTIAIYRANSGSAQKILANRTVGTIPLENAVDVFGIGKEGSTVRDLVVYNDGAANAATLLRPGGGLTQFVPLKQNTMIFATGEPATPALLSDYLAASAGAGGLPFSLADANTTLVVERDKTPSVEIQTGMTLTVDSGTKLRLGGSGSNTVTMKRLGGGRPFYSIYAPSSWLMFASGHDGQIVRYKGGAWNGMTSGVTNNLYGIGGTSAANVFAVGDSGTVIHYDGANWSTQASNVGARLRGVWVAGASDAFAVGVSGTIARYTGSWAGMTSGTVANLNAVWGTSTSNAVAVGVGGVIRRYDGGSWSSENSTVTANLYGVWGSGASDIFAVGDGGTLLHYNGAGWNAQSAPGGATDDLRAVFGLSATEVYAVGRGGVAWKYNGTIWEAESSGVSQELLGLTATASGKAAAVGGGGTIVTRNGATPWETASLLPTPGTYTVNVPSGGALDFSNFAFWHGKATFGAAPTSVSIANGSFDYFAGTGAGDRYLDFNAYTGSALTFNNLTFRNALMAPLLRNIRGPGAGGPVLTVYKYAGDLGGERFDDDPNGLVNWTQSVPNVKIGTIAYTSLSAALAAAGVGDTVLVDDNFAHRGNFTVAGTNVTVAGGLIVGNIGSDGAATGVTIKNMMVKGNIGSGGGVSAPANVYHCSVVGAITAGTEARWSIATGTIAPNTAENLTNVTGASYFTDTTGGDLHLNNSLPAVLSGTIGVGVKNQATTSLETADFDGANTRPAGSMSVYNDIGADELGPFSFSGRVSWIKTDLGPVQTIGYLSAADWIVVGTGQRDSGAAGDWENALVLINRMTGAVVGGIRGAGTARATNVSFDDSLTLPGTVKSVYGYYNYTNKIFFYVSCDSNDDGLTDMIRRIDLPATGNPPTPTWASASVVWSFTVSEGPLGGFDFAGTEPYDLYVVADQDSGREPSGVPVLYKINGTSGAVAGSSTNYRWNYKPGVVALGPDALFTGLRSDDSSGSDIVRFTANLLTINAENLGSAGMDINPFAPTYSSANTKVFATTGDQNIHARNFSNLTTISWGVGSLFDLVAKGVTAGSPVITTPPLSAYRSNWLYAGYHEGEDTYLAKVRLADGDHADTDWSGGSRFAARGKLNMVTVAGGVIPGVYAMTDNGYMFTLKTQNTASGTISDSGSPTYDGKPTHNSPHKVAGKGVQSTFFQWYGTEPSVIFATEHELIRMRN
ncbi:MAG: hypothetical protein HY719_09215 [Planctomycetes bacterium]|nr:hypothetical protein [Planctomycetota bacterium]